MLDFRQRLVVSRCNFKNLIEIQIPISTHRSSERISWAYRDIDESAASPSPVSSFGPQGWFPIQSVQQSWYLLFLKACLLQLWASCYAPKNLGLKTLWDAKGLDQFPWADPSFQPRTLGLRLLNSHILIHPEG